jgi:hypothetical protein
MNRPDDISHHRSKAVAEIEAFLEAAPGFGDATIHVQSR